MIKSILFIIVILAFIYYIKYKKYINPYKLYMIFGKKGSGKSTYLVKLAIDYQKKGYKVYTNMEDMLVPDVRHFKEDDLGKFVPDQNSVILWDEAGMKFDNRNFRNFSTDTRDFFILQRHYKVIVYLVSQSYNVDKKLRDLVDRMYLVQNIAIVYTLIRPIRKTITLTESTSEAESRIAENLKFEWLFSWKFVKLTKYTKYFESFVVPEKPQLTYTIQENIKPKSIDASVARPQGLKILFPVSRFLSRRWPGRQSK